MTLTLKYLTPIVNSEYKEFDLVEEETQVEYLGHVVGGNVRVKLPDGREGIIHPGNTKELG